MQFLNRNRTTQLLMGLSLLLLLVFLLFWLRKEYKEQYDFLAKDSNVLFDYVIRDVRDSLLFFDLSRKALILEHKGDTSDHKHASSFSYFEANTNRTDSNRIVSNLAKIRPKTSITITADSITAFPRVKKWDNVQFKALRDGRKESNEIVVKALSFALREMRTGDTLIKIGPDSLPSNRLYTLFSDTLQKVHKKLPFTIHRIAKSEEVPHMTGIITNTFQGDYSKRNQYFAQLEGYQWYLVRKIGPQILFSFVLFSITSLSFFLIYKSWQNQSRLTQIKNDFISNITHELKTPITTVGVALEALSDFEVLDNPQKTQEYLGISQNELKRLNLLVDKVLQMSKFEKQVPQLKIERIDLDQTIDQIINSMKLQFEKHDALVEFKTIGNNFQLEGDRSHLSSVIYNLIDNALKYSKEFPKIHISLKDIGDSLSLEVKDNGMGIPKAYQEKIFDKFFRIPSGDRHNVKGHGLGLSYVAGIIQQHKGSIHLESTEGKGSCFYIQFPKFQNIV